MRPDAPLAVAPGWVRRRRSTLPARIWVAGPAVAGQHIRHAGLERAILAIFENGAGSDIDEGTPRAVADIGPALRNVEQQQCGHGGKTQYYSHDRPRRLPVHSCQTNTEPLDYVSTMAVTPEELFAALDALGIKHATVKHPLVFTVEQASRLRGQVPGGHTKNLFLRDKKHALYLVVALEDAEIDLKGLHRLLGASGRFSFGSADLLAEVWGVAPGAVTPFGAINDRQGRVTVVLDAAMMVFETLNYHPLVNTMTTSIAREDLRKFLESTGHVPRIESVSGSPADA